MCHMNPQVMGMLYWTTTGLTESIRVRNETMWSPPNVVNLKKLWYEGLAEYVGKRTGGLIVPKTSIGTSRKMFMPNIIMIDFADDVKCKVIYELNLTAPDTFEKL